MSGGRPSTFHDSFRVFVYIKLFNGLEFVCCDRQIYYSPHGGAKCSLLGEKLERHY